MRLFARPWIPVLILPAMMAALLVSSVLARRGPVSEQAYWELISRLQTEIQDLQGSPTEEITSRLAKLADQLEDIQEVQTTDGQVFAIDSGHLLRSLRATPADLEGITVMLDTLLAAHEEYPHRVFSTSDLAALHAILARPEFDWPAEQPNPADQWFQKLLDRFLAWLNEIFGDGITIRLFDANLFLLVSSVVFVFVLFFVFRMIFTDFVKESQIAADHGSPDEPLTSETAFEKAQSLSRGGDFRSAVRYLYLSSLLVLDERGLLRYDRSKTNREYLRSVSQSPQLAQPLEEVIEVFDNVWYGYHSLEEDSFKHYSERVRELKDKKG